MPHVVVKLWPGKSAAQKQRLADRIAEQVTEVLGYGRESVSVSMVEVDSGRWGDEVYRPDIVDRSDELHVRPGYRM